VTKPRAGINLWETKKSTESKSGDPGERPRTALPTQKTPNRREGEDKLSQVKKKEFEKICRSRKALVPKRERKKKKLTVKKKKRRRKKKKNQKTGKKSKKFLVWPWEKKGLRGKGRKKFENEIELEKKIYQRPR